MKKLAVAASIAALAAGLVAVVTPSRPEAPAHLTDRVWIDHMPRTPTDLVTHLIVLENTEGADVGGVIGRSSQWHVALELFQRTLAHDHMRLFFPQAHKSVTLKMRTWRCQGEAPEPFELCLELTAGKDKLLLYSHSDWTLGDELPDAVQAFATVPQATARPHEGGFREVATMPPFAR